MNNETRRATYLRDRVELTPAQERRLRHKGNAATSDRVAKFGAPRNARLGRRFDRKDRREVTTQARFKVAQIRLNNTWARYVAKPSSKRQMRRTQGRGA